MKKILFLITITFLTSINSFGQINDFEYNEELYLEYAITGIKEYYYVSNIKEKFQEQFDIKNYFERTINKHKKKQEEKNKF